MGGKGCVGFKFIMRREKPTAILPDCQLPTASKARRTAEGKSAFLAGAVG